VDYQNEERGLTITPTLEQGNSVELKPVTDHTLLEPIDLAWMLWAKRRFLMRLAIYGLVFSTVIAFLLPRWYTSSTRLMPPDYGTTSSMALALPALSGESGSETGTGSSITGLANRLLGMNTSGDLYLGVLGSRSVEDGIIQKFDLMNVYHARYAFAARKTLAGLTVIKSDADTGIITLSVTDKDPRRAAAMAKEYVVQLNKVLARVNTSSAHRERVFLQHRLETVKTQMDAAAKAFSQFSSKNAAIDIPAQAKAMVSAAADLQGQLIAAQAQLRGLRQIYTDNNVRVQALKAQVAELQDQIDKFGGKNINSVTGSTLGKNELYPSVRQLPLLGVKYLDLLRQSKIDESVFEFLTKEFEIAKLQEARDLPTAEVLDPAAVPEKKSSPHRLYIMLGGMCLAFLLGTGWIVGRAMWDRVDSRQPWKVLGQEVYGTYKNHPLARRFSRAVSHFGNEHHRTASGG
jgi:capsule polysaccharide export protein KpsE/RkpR